MQNAAVTTMGIAYVFVPAMAYTSRGRARPEDIEPIWVQNHTRANYAIRSLVCHSGYEVQQITGGAHYVMRERDVGEQGFMQDVCLLLSYNEGQAYVLQLLS